MSAQRAYVLAACLGAAFGLVVIAAALLKLSNPHGAVDGARWLIPDPNRAVRYIRSLAAFELVVGVGVVVCALRSRSQLLVGTLVVGFVAWDVLRWSMDGPAACGCAAGIELPGGWFGVAAKDLALTVLAVVVWRAPPRPLDWAPHGSPA